MSAILEFCTWAFVFWAISLLISTTREDPSVKKLSSKTNAKPSQTEQNSGGGDPLKIFNKNLLNAHINKKGTEQKAEVDAFYDRENIDDLEIQPIDNITRPKDDYTLKIQPANRAEEVFKNINKNKNSNQQMTPEELISQEMYYDEWLYDFDEEQKREFFQKLKQYARDEGLSIEFDENYKIKSVKKIRKRKIIQY